MPTSRESIISLDTRSDNISNTLATIMMDIINEVDFEPAEILLHHEEGIDLISQHGTLRPEVSLST